jgi:hypothetical protein
LQLEFKVAGLKIEPQNPRPVGFPIGKCKLPLRANSEKSGWMTIRKAFSWKQILLGFGMTGLKLVVSKY